MVSYKFKKEDYLLFSWGKTISFFLVSFMLFLLALRVTLMIKVKTDTADEMLYLKAGQYLAKNLSWENNSTIDNPPLSYYLHGYTLNLFKLKISRKRLFWARFIMLFFPLLLGVYVYKFARKLYGRKAGFFALLLYSFCPNVIAHSGLITTDILVSCFMFITIHYFLECINHMCIKNLLFSGLSLGFALLSKHTAITLLLILPIIWVLAKLLYRKKVKFLYLILTLVLGLFILNLGYGFRDSFKPLSAHRPYLQSKLIIKMQKILPWMPSLFPFPYTIGLDRHQHRNELGHPSFLLGRHFYRGLWYYFPATFLLKTPLPLVILIFFSLFMVKFVKWKNSLDELSLIASILFIFFIACFLNHRNAGFRYIFPVLPFLYVLASRIINLKNKSYVLLIYILILWYAADSLIAHPHYIEYFSETIGGSKNGYKFLVDSNLDWGQNKKLIEDYLEEHKEAKIALARRPITGQIVVNANNLQDVFRLRQGYKWLRRFKPIGNIGYSYLLFNITTSDYEKLVQNNPNDAECHYYLAYIYYMEGKTKQAIKELHLAIKNNSNFCYAYNLLGIIYLFQNDLFEAERNFKKAIQSDAFFSEPYRNLSLLYKESKMYKKSEIEKKREFIAKVFDSFTVRPSSSVGYYFEKLKVEPTNPELHNNLGFIYWMNGLIDKAIDEFKIAVTLDSWQTQYLINLGYSYYEKKRYNDALKYIKKCEAIFQKIESKKSYAIGYRGDTISFDAILYLPYIDSKILEQKLRNQTGRYKNPYLPGFIACKSKAVKIF